MVVRQPGTEKRHLCRSCSNRSALEMRVVETINQQANRERARARECAVTVGRWGVGVQARTSHARAQARSVLRRRPGRRSGAAVGTITEGEPINQSADVMPTMNRERGMRERQETEPAMTAVRHHEEDSRTRNVRYLAEARRTVAYEENSR